MARHHFAALLDDELIHQRVIGRAINETVLQSGAMKREPNHFPIGEMAGHENSGPLTGDDRVQSRFSSHANPAAFLERAKFLQMRKFRGSAAKVFPDLLCGLRDLILAPIREGFGKIIFRAS